MHEFKVIQIGSSIILKHDGQIKTVDNIPDIHQHVKAHGKFICIEPIEEQPMPETRMFLVEEIGKMFIISNTTASLFCK